MREVKPLNMSAGEAEGKQDFCSYGDVPLSLSTQEELQEAQTSH